MIDKTRVVLALDKDFDFQQVLELYQANKWSSASKPEPLKNALLNSHTLVTAIHDDRLVGLGNAISDGHLVVYFPHLLVHPDYHGYGIGRMIIDKLASVYNGFHQQMLTADKDAVNFYQKCGFEKAGDTVPMWKYDGDEH